MGDSPAQSHINRVLLKKWKAEQNRAAGKRREMRGEEEEKMKGDGR